MVRPMPIGWHGEWHGGIIALAREGGERLFEFVQEFRDQGQLRRNWQGALATRKLKAANVLPLRGEGYGDVPDPRIVRVVIRMVPTSVVTLVHGRSVHVQAHLQYA